MTTGKATDVDHHLRKRGWSNISEDLKSEDNIEEGELPTEDETRALMANAFPTTSETEETDLIEIVEDRKSDCDDVIEILDSDTDNSGEDIGGSSPDGGVAKHGKVHIIEIAKQRLSKWSTRLLDPDRPRPLVETPEIIPLNDEFLSAFGKRSKQDDDELGREPPEIIGVQDNTDETNVDTGDDEITPMNEKKKSSEANCKVKISNLAYTTTERNLHRLCEEYGPVVVTNIMMNENRTRSVGYAYVLFENSDAAIHCSKEMNHLLFEGRILNVSLAQERSRRSGGKFMRFWENDISRKCFRCGNVGHIVSDCPNEESKKPCPICAGFDHEIKSCPMSVVCFNCGIPGHASRSCSKPRGLPNRVVCGACFQSGHHRWQCHAQPWNISSYDAVCSVCGQIGHFMCKDIRWTRGLDNISCFNCGQQGHHGADCKRPKVSECSRDLSLVQTEIERAEDWTTSNEVSNARCSFDNQRGRSTLERSANESTRSRPRSQPPPPRRHDSEPIARHDTHMYKNNSNKNFEDYRPY